MGAAAVATGAAAALAAAGAARAAFGQRAAGAIVRADAAQAQGVAKAAAPLAAAGGEASLARAAQRAAALLRRALKAWKLFLRGCLLAALFVPVGVTAVPLCGWLSAVGGTEVWAWMLLNALRNAGPVWIKWGQWAASRPDIFPAPIRKRLEELHDAAPEHSFRDTRRMLEEAYGCPLEDIYEEFDHQPVASGSIGQVYRAKLREDVARRATLEDLAAYAAERTLFQKLWDWVLGGASDGVSDPSERVVAVKVRHPWVVDNLESDCMLLNQLVATASKLRPKECARLGETTQHFEAALAQQLDFQSEAVELDAFRRNFRRWRNVTFPRPLRTLSSAAVLVETFENAVPIKEYMEMPGHPINAALARLGLSCLLKMMLMDNHMHADLHPGNIMVQDRGASRLPKIVLLDAGMTVELSTEDRFSLLDLLTGASRSILGRCVCWCARARSVRWSVGASVHWCGAECGLANAIDRRCRRCPQAWPRWMPTAWSTAPSSSLARCPSSVRSSSARKSTTSSTPSSARGRTPSGRKPMRWASSMFTSRSATRVLARAPWTMSTGCSTWVPS